MSVRERSAFPEGLKAFCLLALLALAVRGWLFGNPVIHVDEQFYLLAGERLLAGDIPYLDFWDRKPVGLYLAYAVPAALFANPVIGYQILATLCAALTAGLIFATARRLTGFGPALAGGAAYIVWLPLFGGIGGQAPVLFNLPMALAASLVMGLVGQTDLRGITRRGCAIMLLAGLAMQIKYSAVFEGVWFGLTLLWLGWRRGGTLPWLAGRAALWITCALAPTLAIWAAYAARGLGSLYFNANFVSVLSDEVDFGPALLRLFWQVLGLTPFWLCLWAAQRHWRGNGQALWLIGWAGASFGGYLVFGNWFDHYVLTMLVPLSTVAALGFAAINRRRLAMALVLGIGLAAGLSRAVVDRADRGTRAEVARLTAMVKQHRHGGCLYVTEDIPVLFALTRACLPSRFAFPEHLVLARYTHALGVNQADEMRKMLAARPSVIVFLHDLDSVYAPVSRGMLLAELARSYYRVGAVQTGAKTFVVYARRGGAR